MKRDYLSFSALKAFSKSPNHYLEYVNRTKEPSPAMEFGSLVHCLTLEPDEVMKRYLVAPSVDKRTKIGKETWKEFTAQAEEEGKLVIAAKDYDVARYISDAVMQHPTASNIVHHTKKEQEFNANLYGVDFKGFIDGLGSGYMFDLKTTQSAHPDDFQRSAYNSGYHLQAAIYRLAIEDGEPYKFFWIAVEKEAPYNVGVYMQSEEAYYKSVNELSELVRAWKEWDGAARSYNDNQAMELSLPRWAK